VVRCSALSALPPPQEDSMSVYRVIDVIGTSETSWEDAAAEAIRTARSSVRDVRIAEVIEQDVQVSEGDRLVFRTKLRLSFKYEQSS
jgi:flavin-binding protein dodecin